MCGIAGVIGPAPLEEARGEMVLNLMRNRGPDANGIYRRQLANFHVTLFHSRLSIIDLDPRSNQPFVEDDCVLVFNGEIYNYRELREDLRRRGHVFRTNSDTEVIIKAYREYGAQCLQYFEGMWAIALLDLRDQSLLLSRDRFGEKPLFYAIWDGVLYFASEIKFLASLSGRTPQVNAAQVKRYLVNGYKALYKRPETFFDDVYEFPVASHARLKSVAQPEPQQFWSLAFKPAMKLTMSDALAGIRERMFRALELRLRADVPLAFCLSGGVDSTVLASIAVKHFDQQVHAFSIVDKDARYDESDNLGVTVDELGCEHHVIHVSQEGFLDRLTELVGYHDSPISTISYYVHSFLSEAISDQGFKVAISGTGADEMFTGYYDHYAFWLAEMKCRDNIAELVDDWRKGYGTVVRNPVLQDPLVFAKSPNERSHIFLNRDIFNDALVDPIDEDFVEESYCGSILRNRMINELMHESVPVMLHEDDLNSMRWSIENRSPYLDRHLVEYLYTVPSEHLIHDGYAKWLLRAATLNLAPEQVILDRRKRGFNASIESLIDTEDPETRDRLLDPGPIFDFVRREAVEKLLNESLSDNSYSKFLFSFISAKLFMESDLVRGTAT